jgi:hypothetical protein
MQQARFEEYREINSVLYLQDVETSDQCLRVQVLESITLEIHYSNQLPINWCPVIANCTRSTYRSSAY